MNSGPSGITVQGGWSGWHRKRRETKQQPSMLPPSCAWLQLSLFLFPVRHRLYTILYEEKVTLNMVLFRIVKGFPALANRRENAGILILNDDQGGAGES